MEASVLFTEGLEVEEQSCSVSVSSIKIELLLQSTSASTRLIIQRNSLIIKTSYCIMLLH